MAGPFGKQTAPSHKPKRNTFDLSHQNNLSMEFGKLYPFLCEPVIPGDSVRLDTVFGIRAMPTAFPLQTKIRADVHYFYVRNRNLWKDWPDFIGQTRDDLVMPYVTNKTMPLSNGSLSDYLNIPTSFSSPTVPFYSDNVKNQTIYSNVYTWSNSAPRNYLPDILTPAAIYIRPSDNPPSPSSGRSYATPSFNFNFLTEGIDFPTSATEIYLDLAGQDFNDSFGRNVFISVGVPKNSGNLTFISNLPSGIDSKHPGLLLCFIPLYSVGRDKFRYVLRMIDPYNYKYVSSLPDGTTAIGIFRELFSMSEDICISLFYIPDFDNEVYKSYQPYYFPDGQVGDFFFSLSSTSSVVSEVGNDSRFSSLHLNALPFRAYESIYNAFYRDDRNNPYILNGEKVYNKYLPSQDGGLDENRYTLRSRNWEQDFLTTAVDSPQQGIAPLVGISSTGVASFALDDGSVEKVQLKVGDDGDTIVGAEYSNNLSPSVARQLVNVATSGISINDFRGVNALQRWLEINIRRGLKYKDQIESHFGVTPSYAELDMPEFLGGATQWFDSSQVNQTSEASSGSPLGSYAGQLSLVGGSNHPVTRFFDEHGYIIGIISISPVPVYINTLHADFLKSSPLDYFFPEFAHLGYQPIPYSQVSPLEKFLNNESLDDTFGYQRAWYEYMSRTDEAHGDFRGDLRDFLLMRRFLLAPTLTKDFLTIDQKQLNQVFTVNEINGNPVMPFLGQIHIKEIFKRPIPRYQISTLE